MHIVFGAVFVGAVFCVGLAAWIVPALPAVTYPGVFSATLLALVMFKFVEPFVESMRDKLMGWDTERTEDSATHR